MYFFMVWLLVLLWPPPVLAEGVPYSAIVTAISGTVTVTRPGSVKPLELGTLLYAGGVVDTAAGASLTINYVESGEEEQWPGGLRFTVGKIRSDPLTPQVRRTNRKVETPDLDGPGGGMKTRSIKPPGD